MTRTFYEVLDEIIRKEIDAIISQVDDIDNSFNKLPHNWDSIN